MKKRKGMTLMEILISMGVYAVLALLATEIMTSMNVLMRSTDQLNDRMSYQAKYADNFQTQDEHGNSFAKKDITYQIEYGGKLVGNTSRNAFQYTIGYDNSRVSGTNYVSEVNFRFLSFDKVHRDVSSWPGDTFIVRIRVVPYFHDETPASVATQKTLIQSAKTNMSKAGDLKISVDAASGFIGVAGTSWPAVDLKTLGLGGETIIDLKNVCEHLPAGTKQVKTEFSFETEKDFFGDGTMNKWSESKTDIYQFVNTGSGDETAAYYNQCVIEFNANTGEFKPFKSLTKDDTPPAIVDYEAILTGP